MLVTPFRVGCGCLTRENTEQKVFDLQACVYFQPNKKRRGPREGRCHAKTIKPTKKTMMSTKANERLKYTLRVVKKFASACGRVKQY